MDRKFVLGLVRDWGIALLAAVAIFVGWSWLFGGLPVASGEAPDFALPDLEGETVQLSALRDGPVLVNFWATWCGPCKAEIPAIQAFADANEDIRVIGVSVDDAIGTPHLARWVEAANMDYTVLHDRSKTVSTSWGVSTLPTTFVLSADGHIVTHRVGMVDRDDLDRFAAAAREHAH